MLLSRRQSWQRRGRKRPGWPSLCRRKMEGATVMPRGPICPGGPLNVTCTHGRKLRWNLRSSRSGPRSSRVRRPVQRSLHLS